MHGFSTSSTLLINALSVLGEPVYHGVGVLLLAGIFGLSGGAKLRRPALAAMAMVDFGIVRKVRPPLGAALGAAEGLLAGVLVVGAFAQAFLLAATILLSFFVVLIARQLLSGRTFPCFCLGDADALLSRWTLARTAALAVLAMLLTVLAPITNEARELPAGALQAVTAAAIIGTVLLGGQITRLVRGTAKLPNRAAT